MSNCVVGSGGLWAPPDVVAYHCVEHSENFSHHRDYDDLRSLSSGVQAIVKEFERGVATTGDQGSHVEDAPNWRAAAPDATYTSEFSAVEVIRRNTDESRDLFAAHLSELWQQGNERDGQHWTDAWHRDQQA